MSAQSSISTYSNAPISISSASSCIESTSGVKKKSKKRKKPKPKPVSPPEPEVPTREFTPEDVATALEVENSLRKRLGK